MTRPTSTDKADYALRAYAAGKTMRQVAAEIGVDPSTIGNILRRNGIKPRMSGPARANVDSAEIVRRYQAGESVKALSESLDASRPAIQRRLIKAGIPIRGASEATRLVAATMTPDQRRAQAAAAQAALRGRPAPLSQLHAQALARQRNGPIRGKSPGEDRLAVMLDSHGVNYVRELAIGKYNVDFAFTAAAVAVEVLGGNWHSTKRTHATRTPHILNAGWTIIFVWDIKVCPLGPGAGKYLVNFIQFARRNSATRREYRVIRGDGQLLAVGNADDDDFSLIPPSHRDL